MAQVAEYGFVSREQRAESREQDVRSAGPLALRSSPSAPCFLITIDTEGDNLWSRPREITTGNSRYLPRFQELCERHGLKPTYLTNWEMARCPVFREFGRDMLRREAGEIGMHLHAWNNPPLVPLTDDDYRYQPYLYEYPPQVMRDKIVQITDRLEDVFQVRIVSHRAGRWGLNETYTRLLLDRGYQVDCSVTPHLSWSDSRGRPDGNGGPDYRQAPDDAYFLDAKNIHLSDDASLLEVPVTVRPCRRGTLARGCRRLAAAVGGKLGRRVLNRFWPEFEWLRPNGRNLSSMLGLVERAVGEQASYVEFTLHSSELMPGGSPRFPTKRHIERLYDHLECLFAFATKTFHGATLAEFGHKAKSRERRGESKKDAGCEIRDEDASARNPIPTSRI